MTTEIYKKKLKEELQKLKLELIAATGDDDLIKLIRRRIEHYTRTLKELGG